MTGLPMYGRLLQSDNSALFLDNTTVMDPLGRLVYTPGPYVRGLGVDSLQFSFSNGRRPMLALLQLLTLANGTDVPSVWSLVQPSWAPFAVDCGGRDSPADPACASVSPLSPPANIRIDISPVDMPALPSGQFASLQASTGIDFDLRSTDSSMAAWQEVFANSTADARKFLLTSWVASDYSAMTVGVNGTILSLYAWCNSNRTTICEAVRLWMTSTSTTTLLGLMVRCGSTGAVASTSITVPTLPTWNVLATSWSADLSSVAIYFAEFNFPVLATGVTCPLVPDDSNAASVVAGATRMVVGSRLAGPSIVSVTGVAAESDTELYVDHVFGSLDDTRLYQYVNEAQREDIMSQLTSPFTADGSAGAAGDAGITLSSGATLLSWFGFDSPVAMYWQPAIITSVFPQWFQYRNSLQVRPCPSLCISHCVVVLCWSAKFSCCVSDACVRCPWSRRAPLQRFEVSPPAHSPTVSPSTAAL